MEYKINSKSSKDEKELFITMVLESDSPNKLKDIKKDLRLSFINEEVSFINMRYRQFDSWKKLYPLCNISYNPYLQQYRVILQRQLHLHLH